MLVPYEEANKIQVRIRDRYNRTCMCKELLTSIYTAIKKSLKGEVPFLTTRGIKLTENND